MAKKLCSIVNCRKPAVAHDYCETHYKRWKRHGHVERTRPSDWGDREKHPLYSLWCSIRRFRGDTLCEEWREDFWAFAREIKERPHGAHRPFLERHEEGRPLGPGNWFWGEPKRSPSGYSDQRGYQREWQRRMRASNPDYFREKQLKRLYGVTLAWYDEKLEQQRHACAICGEPERSSIRGRIVRLAVDHRHDTNRVRGLLCGTCNRGIGFFRHSEELLMKAIAYLKSHEETA